MIFLRSCVLIVNQRNSFCWVLHVIEKQCLRRLDVSEIITNSFVKIISFLVDALIGKIERSNRRKFFSSYQIGFWVTILVIL